MTDRTRAEHILGVFDAKTRFVITTQQEPAASTCEGTATIVIRTGECWLQTNASADQCRAIARSFLAAAVDLDRMAAQKAQPVQEAA